MHTPSVHSSIFQKLLQIRFWSSFRTRFASIVSYFPMFKNYPRSLSLTPKLFSALHWCISWQNHVLTVYKPISRHIFSLMSLNPTMGWRNMPDELKPRGSLPSGICLTASIFISHMMYHPFTATTKPDYSQVVWRLFSQSETMANTVDYELLNECRFDL